MENLNKENFWNELKDRCPKAMDLFCTWIDKYKQEINWDKLFPPPADPRILGMKFHDLPFEFQNGVLARFDIECFNGVLTGKGRAKYENDRGLYVKGFEDLFIDLEKQLNTQNN